MATGPDAKIQILTAKGEVLPLSPPSRFSFDPTDPTVRGRSRHDIRDTGPGRPFVQLAEVLKSAPESVRDLGSVARPDLPRPARGVEWDIPPGVEKELPKGGRRTVYFEADAAKPGYGLPVLIRTLDHSGKEVEYYRFDNLRPAKFTDADFDADRLWKN